jgi:hypothetical protein
MSIQERRVTDGRIHRKQRPTDLRKCEAETRIYDLNELSFEGLPRRTALNEHEQLLQCGVDRSGVLAYQSCAESMEQKRPAGRGPDLTNASR